jgi:uncharacterized protein YyaL (SSP411 family)
VPVRLLLRYHRRTGDNEALQMATLTLEKMAAGGLHDQLGGGFHRYSTDAQWLAPHFEKMLYDNALLATAYSEAHQATGRRDFARVARQTLDYVLREMTSPEGAFYSATDADSEGEEGRFFVWSEAEVRELLGPSKDTDRFVKFYDVSSGGNWEGSNILRVLKPDEDEWAALEPQRTVLYDPFNAACLLVCVCVLLYTPPYLVFFFNWCTAGMRRARSASLHCATRRFCLHGTAS